MRGIWLVYRPDVGARRIVACLSNSGETADVRRNVVLNGMVVIRRTSGDVRWIILKTSGNSQEADTSESANYWRRNVDSREKEQSHAEA